MLVLKVIRAWLYSRFLSDSIPMQTACNQTRLTSSHGGNHPSEVSVVKELAASPTARVAFVNAAKYFESIGDTDTADSIYRGVIPASLAEKHNLKKIQSVQSTAIESCECIGWFPEQLERIVQPANADVNRNSVFVKDKHKVCPPESLEYLCNGSFIYDGRNKLVLDESSRMIDNHSGVNAYLCQPLANNNLSASVRFEGLSVLLTARNSSNFYHWHFDVLTALGMVEECGIKLAEIDNIILTKKESSFQLPMLELLGISDKQIKIIEPGYHYVHCDEMLLPRISNQMGKRQPRKHISWLREKYLNKRDKAQDKNRAKKIAIVRDVRGYSDAALVNDFLCAKGYQLIQPEHHSYIEQASIFHNAESVVAPHGAGLSLISYCKPGTTIHEFYGEHVQPCFWYIASAVGLEYRNYNCSNISSAEITSSGRDIAARADKTIDVTSELLHSMESV